MKKIKNLWYSIFCLLPCLMFCGCSNSEWTNPGDSLGGGKEAVEVPTESSDETIEELENITENITSGQEVASEAVPTGATAITASNLTISSSGNYYVKGEIDLGTSQIKVTADDVVIYFDGVTINKITDKKVVNAKKSTTIVLVDGTTNTLRTTYDDCDVLGSDADLTIMGGGELNLIATDDCISVAGTLNILGGTINCTSSGGHGISAESIIVKDSEIITATVDKDGLHAEIDYDDITTAPTFTYEKGFVYLDNVTATITTTGSGDGIQADTFIQIVSGTYGITTNSGAPTSVTGTSSDNAAGKAIKAGLIDWGTNNTELESSQYAIYLQGGNFTINSNDDAIHSNGYLAITGGTYNISTGDDGVHADSLLKISGGTINITKSYEGIESAKIEISGGTINVKSADDGINAADGTSNQPGQSNSNCYLIISGGTIIVNSTGDGLDSNGTILITGGNVYVHGPTSGADGALDSDGGIIVNGGTLFAVGSLGMVETPSTSSSLYVISFASQNAISSGTILTLTDSSGNTTYAQLTTSKSCQSVIISCSSLTSGETYKLYGGSTVLATITITSKITVVGSSTSSTNPGGRPNGR